MVRTIVQQFLDRYPQFYTQDTELNHYKYVSLLALILKDVDTEKLKVTASNDIDRPLQLWKSQIHPKEYNMLFKVILIDIKRVKLYRDDTQDELVISLTRRIQRYLPKNTT
jgi:hypothetical protein